jgi:hypothetical protein
MTIVKVAGFEVDAAWAYRPINMNVVFEKIMDEKKTMPQVAMEIGAPITTLKKRLSKFPYDHPVRVKVRENYAEWNKKQKGAMDAVPLDEETWAIIERMVRGEEGKRGKTLFEISKALQIGAYRLNTQFKWRYFSPTLRDGKPNPRYDLSMHDRVERNSAEKIRDQSLAQNAINPETLANKFKGLTPIQWTHLLGRLRGGEPLERVAQDFGMGASEFLKNVPEDFKDEFARHDRGDNIPLTEAKEKEMLLKARELLQSGSSPEAVGLMLGLDMRQFAAMVWRRAKDDPVFRPVIFPNARMKTTLPSRSGRERERLRQQKIPVEAPSAPVTAGWLLPMCKFASGEVLENKP